ncbi:MAG: Swt1 family HEPN domain-containing protein [Acidimicrobiales bacterium]
MSSDAPTPDNVPVDSPVDSRADAPGRPDQSGAAPDLARSRHGLLAEAFETLALAMGPFIDQRMSDYFHEELSWEETAANRMGRAHDHGATDPLFQLLVLRRFWGPVFADFFGEDLRPLIGQIIEARNLWAHFNLPDDADYIDRMLLTIERLVAPVAPDATSGLRGLRTRLRNPSPSPEDLDAVPTVDSDRLRNQLAESEGAFSELQDEYNDLAAQLEVSRKAALGRQHRITTIEQQLSAVHNRSDILAAYLEEERSTRQRIEWLFVGLIAALMVLMLLVAG